MTENKGSSQPKNNGNNGKSDEKKNRNVKRTIIKIIGFMFIAFIVLLLLGILLFAYYAWKAPAFTESKLEDPIPAKIYDKNGDLVTNDWNQGSFNYGKYETFTKVKR